MVSNPRLRRLEADHRSMLELKSQSDLIDFEVLSGLPPHKYRIRLRCRGVYLHPENNKKAITVNHAVLVNLHSEYPRKQPAMKWETPIYHPNINRANGGVCIQYWAPSKSLADLVMMLYDMVRYENYNVKSPLDTEAANWANKNAARFPVDSRPLTKPEIQISIAEASEQSEEGSESDIIVILPPTQP